MTAAEVLTRELLLQPTAASIEEAVNLLEGLSGRTEGLDTAEARRTLEVCRTLAEQAGGHYGWLKALVEARLASYTASGEARLPEGHQLAIDG
mgnify:CR=1 FL=1